MDIISIITAFGADSILTSVIQYYVSNKSEIRKRRYDERKEAYVGLLEAWVRQHKEGYTEASDYDVGHWHLRAQLVASEGVFSLLHAWKEAAPGSPERIDATKRLKLAMRDDLRSL